MTEIWKENKFNGNGVGELVLYLETVSAGYPDPLIAYLPYVSDNKTNLLEYVLRKFLFTNQYSNDYRYIKLWIIYADSMEKPDEIYNYLLERNIGKACSILYVALADVYESYHWYDLAELIYLRGIINKAMPFQKTYDYYIEFFNRKQEKKSIL